jgi:oligosaccharide repeat unit polymerase
MVEFCISIIIFIFCIGLITIFTLGIKKHYFYFFVTGIQIFYLFNTPFYRFLIDDYYAINVDVKDYFPFGFTMILLHIILFNIFYFSTKANFKSLKFINSCNNEMIKKVIYRLFIILYILIFINTLIGGVNLVDVILGRANTTTLGMPGATYYIQNFADSLITLLVAAYIFKVKKKHRIIMFILGFTLFIILGFRYRILLTVFAIVLYNIYKNGIKARLFLRYLTFSFIFFYSILFLTFNRVKLYSGFYNEITYDPSLFNYNIFFDQAKGSLVDFALYKALDNDVIESDRGETMFLYVFIKMIPAKFFPDDTKPYPPPFLPALDKAIDGSRDFGEASTILGSFYFAFSYFGIIFISILLGISVKRLTVYNNRPVSILFNLMIMMAIFQFYTRGYLPMFVDHLAYMLFPCFFIKKYSKDFIYNEQLETKDI